MNTITTDQVPTTGTDREATISPPITDEQIEERAGRGPGNYIVLRNSGGGSWTQMAGPIQAANGDEAIKEVAHRAMQDEPSIELVAVAERFWKPRSVTAKVERTIHLT